jgi:FkbM family methyltransferase
MNNGIKRFAKFILPRCISSEISAYLSFKNGFGKHFTTDKSLRQHYAGRLLQKTGGIYVEVGAATGNSCIPFVKRYKLNPSHCHFIEACPTNFEILRKKSDGFKVYNYAITGHTGLSYLYSLDDSKEEGSSRSNSIVGDSVREKFPDATIEKIQIPSRTLTDFFDEQGLKNIDFIFFNCEGAEYEIFRGNTSFLDRTSLISLDLHGCCEKFNSVEMKSEKTRIFNLMTESGFDLIAGNTKEDISLANHHLSFLWEKQKD